MSDLDVYDGWVERLDAPTRQHVERMNGRISDLMTAIAAERARAERAELEVRRLRAVAATLVSQADSVVARLTDILKDEKWGPAISAVAKLDLCVDDARARLAITPDGKQREPAEAAEGRASTYEKQHRSYVRQLDAERERCEAAEGREARLRPVWDAVERMQVVRASMYGLVDTVLDDDSAVEAVGNAMESANRALFSAALDVLDVYRAALAGSPSGVPARAPRESYPARIIVTEVRRGEPTVYPDETTAPECRDGWHAVKTGAAACLCGENRTELLL